MARPKECEGCLVKQSECHEPVVTFEEKIHLCPCTTCLVKVTCDPLLMCDAYAFYNKIVGRAMSRDEHDRIFGNDKK